MADPCQRPQDEGIVRFDAPGQTPKAD